LEAKRLDVARTLLLKAVSHSRKHFSKEERIVFPMAERVMSGKTLEKLGKAWLERRSSGSPP
jgi:hemerythrin-like domain-containing protein